jgi:hypothetical protein
MNIHLILIHIKKMIFKACPRKIFFSFSIISIIFMVSCSNITPSSNHISSASDGSYVVSTDKSDQQLIQEGVRVVYRFTSIPHMVAVQNIGNKRVFWDAAQNQDLYGMVSSNKRERLTLSQNNTPERGTSTCSNAYCEAHFDKTESLVQKNSPALTPVKVALIDSGVVEATSPIKQKLNLSDNLTNDTNRQNWLDHATMISSVLAGVMSPYSSTPFYVYAPNARIDSIKINLKDDGSEGLQKNYGSMQLAVALDKAVSYGARIVNLSLNYDKAPDDSVMMAEQIVMSQGAKMGTLFVVSAGNDSSNLDFNPIYPANYDLNNLIVVGSHNANLTPVKSSNYGTRVDLTAQGAAILVNDKKGQQIYVGGTSFAAPLVVGALAQYLGLYPQHDTQAVLSHLFQSSNTYYTNQVDTPSFYGRLDAYAFLKKGEDSQSF